MSAKTSTELSGQLAERVVLATRIALPGGRFMWRFVVASQLGLIDIRVLIATQFVFFFNSLVDFSNLSKHVGHFGCHFFQLWLWARLVLVEIPSRRELASRSRTQARCVADRIRFDSDDFFVAGGSLHALAIWRQLFMPHQHQAQQDKEERTLTSCLLVWRKFLVVQSAITWCFSKERKSRTKTAK